MQTYADVLRLPISTIASEQGPALGSAIHAAVAAGRVPRRPSRRRGDGRGRSCCVPARTRTTAAVYDRLYEEYRELHDWFGRGGNQAMKRLRSPRADEVAWPGARSDRLRGARPTRSRAVREDVARLHARAGAVRARRLDGRQRLGSGPGRRPVRDQAVRRLLRRARRGPDDPVRPGRQRGPRDVRQRATAVQRHRGARVRLPAHARGRRGRAHPLDVRRRLGRARRGDPVRDHRDGRRVRRSDPGGPVRGHRGRLHRARHRRDAARDTGRGPC